MESDFERAEVPMVFIVDDDASIRESLENLFASMRMDVAAFESPSDFLAIDDFRRPGCILLDVRLPGINGLDFHANLTRLGCTMPVVFMTGHGDIAMSVRAMKAGAADFLAKPFKEQAILDAVLAAIEYDRVKSRQKVTRTEIVSRLSTLSQREKEVMDWVITGMMNKKIAHELGISEITVKLHRGSVMKKMNVRTLADLVRAAELADEAASGF
jgi:FixJ family two-component response regulator